MPLDDARIARGNSKLAADYENVESRNVMFCCNGADNVGHTLAVEKVSTAGTDQLAIIVKGKDGERISPPARGDSEPLITVRTPLSRPLASACCCSPLWTASYSSPVPGGKENRGGDVDAARDPRETVAVESW